MGHADTLLALGGAFPAAAFPARLGGRLDCRPSRCSCSRASCSDPAARRVTAIFLFAVGLSIDPGVLMSVAGPVAAAAAVTVVMNVVAGLFVARLHGHGARPASHIATTLGDRGDLAGSSAR